MKCINDELIQKYIDGEATIHEKEMIEKHISSCTTCAGKIATQRKLSELIRRDIRQLGKSDITIPQFIKPPKKENKKYIPFRKYISIASVACILFLLFLLIPGKTMNENIVFFYGFENEFDANLPVSEQIMTFQIIDANGNITEYH